MLKKLSCVLVFLVVVIVGAYLIQDVCGDSFIGTVLAEYYFIYAIVWGVVSLIFGAIALYVSESKGYTGGFAWGFWLGVIGLLVVGFRPNKKQCTAAKPQAAQKLAPVEVLERLAALHQQGLLTDEEYQSKKTEILKRM